MHLEILIIVFRFYNIGSIRDTFLKFGWKVTEKLALHISCIVAMYIASYISTRNIAYT